jgi:tRNA (guanine37-N1)-methyltransferase
VWQLETTDLRTFGEGRHKNVDDTPSGGGAGMVMRADVVGNALATAHRGARHPMIYLSPRGKKFDQGMAQALARESGVTLLCGRFEGVDERILERFDIIEISLGDFVLTGGELAAQMLLDATVRLLPGVLGNAKSALEESFSNGLLEHPQYTRPAEWEGMRIPDVLTSGNHKKIAQWRQQLSERITEERRPDLWQAYLKKD